MSLALFSNAGMTPDFLDAIILKMIDITLLQKASLDLSYLAGGLILFSLSLAFVASYALFREKIDWMLIGISAAMFVFILAFSGIGSTTIALGTGVLLLPLLVQYVTIDDKKAYKELRPGRIASHAAETAVLVISLLVTLSVFHVTSSDASYADKAVDETVDATLMLAIDGTGQSQQIRELKAIPGGEQMFDEKMNQLKEQIKAMPVFGLVRTAYPYMSAVTAFASVQLFSMLIIAPLTGFFAWALWKLMNWEAAHAASSGSNCTAR